MLEGLSEINLREAATEVAKGSSPSAIKRYCEALSGSIGGNITINLQKVDTIAAAVKQGTWVTNLTVAIGAKTIRAVMPLEVFKELIAD